MNAPKVDRSVLERHANGVSGLKGVVVVAKDPAAYRNFLQNLAGVADVTANDTGLAVETEGGTVVVLDLDAANLRYGVKAAATGSLELCGAIFGVAELAAAEWLFKANAISYEKRDRKIIVPPASGQGTTFVFEAA